MMEGGGDLIQDPRRIVEVFSAAAKGWRAAATLSRIDADGGRRVKRGGDLDQDGGRRGWRAATEARRRRDVGRPRRETSLDNRTRRSYVCPHGFSVAG